MKRTKRKMTVPGRGLPHQKKHGKTFEDIYFEVTGRPRWRHWLSINYANGTVRKLTSHIVRPKARGIYAKLRLKAEKARQEVRESFRKRRDCEKKQQARLRASRR